MLKLLAGLDVKERSKKQSGGIKAGYLEGKYTVRVDIEPMQGGERLTLRLKNNAVKLDTPTDLGYTELLKTKIREGAGHKSGVVLAAGMPMSGVTTTAFAILRGIDAYMYTIYSLADMGGLDLMHIKNFEGTEGDDFVRTITRAKRAEADVIFVDPFRDAEFTKTIFKESDDVTFLSEIASRDSADAIERLSKWLGDPKIVAEKLKLVVGQKLIRVLCDKCKQAYRPHPTLLQKVGLPPETKVLYRMPVYVPNEDDEEDEAPPVCKKCGGVGYHGRVGLMEYIEMNEPIKQLVLSGGDAASIRALARKEKMQTFQMDGIRQIGLGKTSLEELQRVFKT